MKDSITYSLDDGDLCISHSSPAYDWRGRIDDMPAVEMHPSSDASAIVLLAAPTGSSDSRNLVRVNAEADVIWRGELPTQTSGDCFLAFSVSDQSGRIVAQTWSGYKVILSADTGALLASTFTK